MKKQEKEFKDELKALMKHYNTIFDSYRKLIDQNILFMEKRTNKYIKLKNENIKLKKQLKSKQNDN